MKLYTEKQLWEICKDVAEKVAATSVSEESIKEKCDDYGHSKIIVTDPDSLKHLMEDDEIDTIPVEIILPKKENKSGITKTQLKNMIIEEKNRINALSDEELAK